MRRSKRSGAFASRSALVSRAYENEQLRPLARMVKNVALRFSGYRDGPELPGQLHPTVGFRDGIGRVEIVVASRQGQNVVSFWADDLRLLLDAPSFTPVELSPDPTATPAAIVAMRKQTLVPLAWEEVL